MAEGTFVTAINCMDGRVQEPVIKWMKSKYEVDYVDMITEAGPNKYLLDGNEDQVNSLKSKVDISYSKHGSKVLAMVGHHDCAGNPVNKEEKAAQIKQAIKKINTWGI
ncbi:carbonic anhydrase [Piscibacillus salipiscarius]|uniref:carbonic anhydrase n=1 Tax=Piscibacillus salipiscarius TaxID=299480 RepID=UPI000ABF68D4|nr:carbonic anhydrase [Piscibacillus salipiscarius]